jgi:hypothetical protein
MSAPYIGFSEFYQIVASSRVLYRLGSVEDERMSRLNGWRINVRLIRMKPFSSRAVSINL